jgi:hypothetical protein
MMKTTNIIQVFHFQLVKIIVAPVMCLFLREKRRKKGAHSFHGICWNFLTDRRKVNELKIVNDGKPLLIYNFFSPLYADVRQLHSCLTELHPITLMLSMHTALVCILHCCYPQKIGKRKILY